MQYLVQMKLADTVRPRSPQDSIAFIEQYVFPTLEVCESFWRRKRSLPVGR